jgi:hypothetical protein
MNFTFKDPGGIFIYKFFLNATFSEHVEIYTYTKNISGPKCWLHLIKDGEIIWRQDNWMEITPEAKNYINKILKLRAFL